MGSARGSLLLPSQSLPVSPSFLCLSPKLLVGEAEQSQQMMLPRAWAACQGALPGAGCLNCLIYCIKHRSISGLWAPALSQSLSLSRALSIPHEAPQGFRDLRQTLLGILHLTPAKHTEFLLLDCPSARAGGAFSCPQQGNREDNPGISTCLMMEKTSNLRARCRAPNSVRLGEVKSLWGWWINHKLCC